jgi:hypothetical protein
MFHPRLLILPVVAVVLTACVVAPYPARRVVYPQPVQPAPYDGDEVVVDVAPPAPYVEVVPAIPYAGAVWIGGYWGWRGGRHAWVPGRWERPRAGYVWRPHVWVSQRGHWHLRGGGWVRR